VTEFEHDGKEPLGNGTFNITIRFSKDMDITSPPRLTIRSTANNTALCIPEGGWTDARTWTGTCKVENSAGVGSYKVEISDGMDLVGNVMLPYTGPVIKVNTTLTGSGTGLPPCLPPEDDDDGNTGSAIPWNLWLIIVIAITLFLVVLVVKRFGRRRSG